uniref:Uncharacterized protein n=1 Tax=Anguilla anguilla TaxID=7936 RepID=A0A0E9WAJ4_ANGAN
MDRCGHMLSSPPIKSPENTGPANRPKTVHILTDWSSSCELKQM